MIIRLLYSTLYNVLFFCYYGVQCKSRSSQSKNRQFALPSFSRSANRTTDITRESTRLTGRLHQCCFTNEYRKYSVFILCIVRAAVHRSTELLYRIRLLSVFIGYIHRWSPDATCSPAYAFTLLLQPLFSSGFVFMNILSIW